jgi:archaemetzincin
MLTRRAWLALTSLLALEGLVEAAPEVEPVKTPGLLPKVLLVPLGSGITEADVDYVRRCLLAFYDFDLEVFARSKLPAVAFYAPRQRYRAEKLLRYLEQLAPKTVARVVGLTNVDISTTKGTVFDWGILGLATVDGRACVLSNFRCRRGTRNDEELKVRFGKTAVHEVGHTLGLPHCPTVGCLMEDAKGSVTTTDREYDLCAQCRKTLISWGRAARDNPSVPWAKP